MQKKSNKSYIKRIKLQKRFIKFKKIGLNHFLTKKKSKKKRIKRVYLLKNDTS
ncbi:hypothetical protein ACWNYQ_00455 [Candidatus Vidania fulgoroideorum]